MKLWPGPIFRSFYSTKPNKILIKWINYLGLTKDNTSIDNNFTTAILTGELIVTPSQFPLYIYPLPITDMRHTPELNSLVNLNNN